jgi:hypothetical protein
MGCNDHLHLGDKTMANGTALRNWDGYDSVGAIMDYEGGEFSAEKTVELFQYLVDTGLAWSLQGSYGRAAAALIERGLVADSVDAEPSVSLDDLED